ncbi:MAG: dihydropteroate synthase [candidate division NC10 bacterium]|nr:dihydropteroate synthase [candidate division NC10 bacterium]
MSQPLRIICIERSSDLREEMRGISLDPRAWESLPSRMGSYGLHLKGRGKDEMELMGREAAALGMEVYATQPASGAQGMLIVGEGGRWGRMAERWSALPPLATLGEELRRSLANLDLCHYSFRCGEWTLELGKKTALMGVLNITPDSFSDGGRFLDPKQAIAHGARLIEEGSDLLDLGGESTRPNSEPISPQEELQRILPPLRSLVKMGVPISVDTYKPEVARVVLQEGACLINDISGLRFHPSLADLIASAGAGLVIMHMKGTPKDMQKDPHYDCLMEEVFSYFQEGIALAESSGVRPEGILIDPGIGFGKTVAHNLTLLRRLREFKSLGKPILIGPSRKSFIGKILDLPVEERLEGTAAAVAWAACHGASMVRVHDVKEMKRVTAMIDALRDGD